MEIKKNINGYTIEVDHEEYRLLDDGLIDGMRYWEEKYGVTTPEKRKMEKLHEEFVKAKKRYLTNKEVKPLVNCMVCKNCLPPFQRKNGRMCKIEKCDFNPA